MIFFCDYYLCLIVQHSYFLNYFTATACLDTSSACTHNLCAHILIKRQQNVWKNKFLNCNNMTREMEEEEKIINTKQKRQYSEIPPQKTFRMAISVLLPKPQPSSRIFLSTCTTFPTSLFWTSLSSSAKYTVRLSGIAVNCMAGIPVIATAVRNALFFTDIADWYRL